MKLYFSIESSKTNITSFASDLDKLIHDQKDTELEEISQKEEAQNMYISGCREMCRLMNQQLDSKIDILLNARRTKDDSNTFVIDFKVAKFLRDAEKIIDMMETAGNANTIDFKVNEYLDDLLRTHSIGKINYMTSGHVTEAETVENTESDTNAIEHPISNNIDVELYDIKRLLHDSIDIDVSYMEPYLHYIQTSTKASKELEFMDSD